MPEIPSSPDEGSTFDQENGGEDFTVTLPGCINGVPASLTLDAKETIRRDNACTGRFMSEEELDVHARQLYQDLQQSFEGGEPPPFWLAKLIEMSNRRMGTTGVISKFVGKITNRS